MIRYVKQFDQYNCGPIAIINALKWSGLKITTKSFRKIQKECRSTINLGTKRRDLDKALRNLGSSRFKVTSSRHPSIKVVENHLKNEGVVLMVFMWDITDRDHCHIALILKMSKSGKTFTMINLYLGETLSKIRRKKLIYYMTRRLRPCYYKPMVYPRIWLLTPNRR